jgi:hypothetical protein
MQTTRPHRSAGQSNPRETILKGNGFRGTIFDSRLGHLLVGALLLCSLWSLAGAAQETNELRITVFYDSVPVAGDHVYLVTIPPDRYTAAKEVSAGGQVEFTFLRDHNYCVVDKEHMADNIPWTAQVSTDNASSGYQPIDLENNNHCEPGHPNQLPQE